MTATYSVRKIHNIMFSSAPERGVKKINWTFTAAAGHYNIIKYNHFMK